ncbi:ATP-binding protein [Vitiosangium sp. GDMCC 1.1324]|uniref:HD domain-containing protein n=1 Tax=Vitiosangium sp. (strain GDMCC 1.1324) TaxID=2138576 RepID=UPI0011B3AED5|nr:ATP-binding protein [Vitiosangium sp. GDMCC 1.1324]
MPDFKLTALWKSTLAPQAADSESAARERLRVEFLSFRERVGQLVAEIPQDLRDYTVHDLTHLDALWEMASILAGDSFALTPLEGFVLGGAILLHDAGMCLAAYPEGRAGLRREKKWLDLFVLQFQRENGRRPTPSELVAPSPVVENPVIAELLRELHAQQAERLPLLSWRDRDDDEPHHLIADVDLRLNLGPLIGRIAHSHWWPASDLRAHFPKIVGAPAGFHNDWTIDPLKVACLLRAADAAHIDARRAPRILRAFRKPAGISKSHWIFQEKLHTPKEVDGSLEYTSGSAFALKDAEAWWLCFETLQMIDHELREVDALLTDLKRQRLKARRVAGAEDPARLVEWIGTSGWEPVDARLRASDVFGLVERIGGKELYGDDPTIPLRELIQNAADAVRARRTLDRLPPNWGRIVVRTGRDATGEWLEVFDSGIGMSRAVVAGPLLDFGTSYWRSHLARQEWPGLIGEGFEPIGRYGIGFFSVFMLGRRVRIITRRMDEGRRDTRVLEFAAGPRTRPVLRPADESELLVDGGTCVRVWLDRPIADATVPLPRLCAWLCPALDVSLFVQDGSSAEHCVVSANDWISMDGKALLERVLDHDAGNWLEERQGYFRPIADMSPSLRYLWSKEKEIVGRAAIHYEEASNLSRGVLCVGGLRACYLHGISGVFLGYPTRAARDSALPLFNDEERIRWAEEQVPLIQAVFGHDIEALQHCASLVFMLGGRTGMLPIAESSSGALDVEKVGEWAAAKDRVYLCERDGHWVLGDDTVELVADALTVDQVSAPVINMPRRDERWPWGEGDPRFGSPLVVAVILAVARAWGISLSDAGDAKTSLKMNREQVTVGRLRTRQKAFRSVAWVLCRPT